MDWKTNSKGVDGGFSNLVPLLQDFVNYDCESMRHQMAGESQAQQGTQSRETLSSRPFFMKVAIFV